MIKITEEEQLKVLRKELLKIMTRLNLIQGRILDEKYQKEIANLKQRKDDIKHEMTKILFKIHEQENGRKK